MLRASSIITHSVLLYPHMERKLRICLHLRLITHYSLVLVYSIHCAIYIKTIRIKISIPTGGDIGSEVKYTANGEHSGMYICLDPIQGGSFAGGLTAKVGSAAEASLTGQGMHMYIKGI